MNRRDFCKALAATGLLAGCRNGWSDGLAHPTVGAKWPGWHPGEFQVHFIYTGVAESMFLIFPDSTSMLLDCGDHEAHLRGKLAVPVLPDLSRHAGEWICRYVQRVNPNGRDVDYMLLSHYHSDHGGQRKFNAGTAPNGKYMLSGFGQALEFLNFKTAIDRAWPTFDDPLSVKMDGDSGVLANMVEVYRELERRGGKVEKFRLERNSDQIRPLRGSAEGFRVVPLCANGRFLMPDGTVSDPYAPIIRERKLKKVNENAMSIGMRFEYGPFRFFSCGDLSDKCKRKDGSVLVAENELAKACGPCQVAKINHHGHHAMPLPLVSALKSRVYVSCVWDQLHNTRDTMRFLADTSAYPGPRTYLPGIFPKERRAEDAGEKWIADIEPATYVGTHIVLNVPKGGENYTMTAIDARNEDMTVLAALDFRS